MTDFEYGYDFSDQAILTTFYEEEYRYIHDNFARPIQQYDMLLEGNFIRMNELQKKVWEIERIEEFDIPLLLNNPMYKNILTQLQRLEEENVTYRRNINYYQSTFHTFCLRKHHDKHVPDSFSPCQILVKDDLIVSSGLDIIGSQITGRSANRWAYFHIGESGQNATMDQQTLKAPIAAYPVSQIGSFTSVGDQIRFFGSIPSTLRSVEIREIGLSTKLTGGFLLNRSTYPENDPLKHIKDRTYPVATIVIYMTSDQAFSTKT